MPRQAFQYAALCLIAILLYGCASKPMSSAPAASANTLASPGINDGERFLVRLWNKPGIFEKATVASLDGDRLFLAGWPRGLEAVDIKTGLTDWMHIGDLPVDVAPTTMKGTVYVAEGGELVTVDRTTGEELTRDTTRAGIMTRIFPGEKSLMVGSGDERIYGIEPGTGMRQYRLNTNGYPIGGTWDGSDLAFFVTSKGILYAVSVPTKAFAWQYAFKRPYCTEPVLSDGIIYVGNEDSRLYAFEPVTGDLKWRMILGGPVLAASPVPIGDRVYASTTDGLIHAVEPATQKVLWSVPGNQVITTTPKHVIYYEVAAEGNYVGVADAATGQVLARVSAMPYKFFRGETTGGIFYAVDETGGVLAMADREVAEEMERAKYRE